MEKSKASLSPFVERLGIMRGGKSTGSGGRPGLDGIVTGRLMRFRQRRWPNHAFATDFAKAVFADRSAVSTISHAASARLGAGETIGCFASASATMRPTAP